MMVSNPEVSTMNYGYQDIRRVMAEASVSFEDADKALKKVHGNINEAVMIALRKKKGRSGVLEHAVDAVVRLFYYRLRVEKGDKTFLDVALWIVAAVFLVGIMISYSHYMISSIGTVAVIIVLLSGSKLTLEPKRQKEAETALVDAAPMEEDEVLQNYPDEEVAEEDGYNSIEV
jgi:redox-sensitive bicupin YhaK (pirin superfamily)